MFARRIAGVLRAISGLDHPKNFTTAIIAAGGDSTRFGGELSKQMTPIVNIPVVIHTLLAFERADCIGEIVVAAKESEIGYYKKLCREHGIKKLTRVVAGGESRQESVKNAFAAIDKRSKYVAISDAARCLVTSEMINEVCRSAYKYGAATAAHKSTDTVKIANKKGFIKETIDRNTVWLAATPQVFKTKIYLTALAKAEKDGFVATDDNMLCEHIRRPVRLVECGPNNIKITTKDDLVAARAILEGRYGAEE